MEFSRGVGYHPNCRCSENSKCPHGNYGEKFPEGSRVMTKGISGGTTSRDQRRLPMTCPKLLHPCYHHLPKLGFQEAMEYPCESLLQCCNSRPCTTCSRGECHSSNRCKNICECSAEAPESRRQRRISDILGRLNYLASKKGLRIDELIKTLEEERQAARQNSFEEKLRQQVAFALAASPNQQNLYGPAGEMLFDPETASTQAMNMQRLVFPPRSGVVSCYGYQVDCGYGEGFPYDDMNFCCPPPTSVKTILPRPGTRVIVRHDAGGQCHEVETPTHFAPPSAQSYGRLDAQNRKFFEKVDAS